MWLDLDLLTVSSIHLDTDNSKIPLVYDKAGNIV